MADMNLEEFNATLLKEKERLERELGSFATRDPKMRDDWDTRFPSSAPSAASSSHASLEEQADLREEFETEIAQEHSLESRLAEVNRAIDRIAENDFGRCKACGVPIPLERLRANPAAEYDIAHQPKE